MSPSPPVFAGVRPRAPAFRYLSAAAAAVLALEPSHCRWPSGEPGHGPFAFCGANRTGAGSYCAAHAGSARRGAAARGPRA